MTRFVGKLPQFEIRGIGGTDPALQRFADSINAILARIPRSIVGVPPIQVSLDGDRWLVSLADQSKQNPVVIRSFLVVDELDDMIKCVQFDYLPNEVQIHDATLGTEDNPTSTQLFARTGGEDDIEVQKLLLLIANNRDGITRDTGNNTTTPEGDDGGDDDEGGDPPPMVFYPGYVYVAKPRLLQRTPFDNQTVLLRGVNVRYDYDDSEKGKRTATASGATAEVQVITPPYFNGDIIAARSGATGLTTVDSDVLGPDDNIGLVVWTDTNEGGREWALDSGS